jgi:hypothetical protein
MFNALYFEASYFIILSFMPCPYSLVNISVYNCSVLSHFISYCACCKAVLVDIRGLGGNGVPVDY